MLNFLNKYNLYILHEISAFSSIVLQHFQVTLNEFCIS